MRSQKRMRMSLRSSRRIGASNSTRLRQKFQRSPAATSGFDSSRNWSWAKIVTPERTIEIMSAMRTPPITPKIDKYSTGIGVNRAEQCAQRIVKPDDENARAERLQIFRHKAHPEFFTRANHKDCDEQDDEISLEPEKIGKRSQTPHARV